MSTDQSFTRAKNTGKDRVRVHPRGIVNVGEGEFDFKEEILRSGRVESRGYFQEPMKPEKRRERKEKLWLLGGFSSVGERGEVRETRETEFIIKKEGVRRVEEDIRIGFVSRSFSFTVIDALTEIARQQWKTAICIAITCTAKARRREKKRMNGRSVFILVISCSLYAIFAILCEFFSFSSSSIIVGKIAGQR